MHTAMTIFTEDQYIFPIVLAAVLALDDPVGIEQVVVGNFFTQETTLFIQFSTLLSIALFTLTHIFPRIACEFQQLHRLFL